MTTRELKNLESALDTRAWELRRSLAARDRIAVERVADEFDQQLVAAERETSARNLELDFRLLRQIDAARARLRKGTFGLCQRCDHTIATVRLQAIPWAIYCVPCQVEAEADALRADRRRAA